jgi:threonine aldolase
MNRRDFLKAVAAVPMAAMVFADLPDAVIAKIQAESIRVVRDPELGISVRFITQWDASKLSPISRFDILGGYSVPQLEDTING